ncbi:Uncharacterized protein FWK35_00023407 [Aphis craccivora]|uniref:Uncharacterized protein n=1 Tax=Aphis craccivora TaxID=307492 RepID=A0A6G0Z596_APHCR|nr:Uncharacterized protein FWK35_00023407 [Aphis craccivora]
MNTKYNHGGLTVVSMFRFDVHIKELYVQIVLQFVLIEHDDVQSIHLRYSGRKIIRHNFEKRFCSFGEVLFFENRNNNLYSSGAVGVIILFNSAWINQALQRNLRHKKIEPLLGYGFFFIFPASSYLMNTEREFGTVLCQKHFELLPKCSILNVRIRVKYGQCCVLSALETGREPINSSVHMSWLTEDPSLANCDFNTVERGFSFRIRLIIAMFKLMEVFSV